LDLLALAYEDVALYLFYGCLELCISVTPHYRMLRTAQKISSRDASIL
jgi:hypothetical protein